MITALTTRPLVRALCVLPLAFGVSSPTDAQTPERVYRVGLVGLQSPGLENRMIAYFQERLVELGYIEGRNVSTLFRWADGEVANYERIAADLVRENVDVIVAPCGAVVRGVRQRQPTIPVVVRSVDLAVDAAAQQTGVHVYRAEWTHPRELAAAFDGAVRVGAGALLTLGDGSTWFNRHHIFELAADRKLPVLYDFPMLPAPDPGLMSYSVETRSLFRHVAEQVDQILRGTKPGDIPLARPRRFHLFVNTEAARSLDLTISSSLLRRNHTTE